MSLIPKNVNERARASKKVAPENILPTIDITFDELIGEVAKATGIALDDTKTVCRKLMELATDHLTSGRNLRLPPLGQITIKTVELNGKPSGKAVFTANTEPFRLIRALPGKYLAQKSQEVS